MRNTLSSFATNSPQKSEKNVYRIFRDRHRITSNNLFIFKLRPMFIILFIALALGGGTVVAAENTVPGDVLYPVKIHVTEQIRDAFEISSEQQAEWDLKKAERRLIEAQKLAQKGVLNANSKAELSERIDSLLTRVEEGEGGKDSALLHVNLQALLRAHSSIFDSFVTTTVTGTSRIELGSLLDVLKVKYRQAPTSTVTSTKDRDVNFETAALGKQHAAEQKLSEVESYIARKFVGFTVSSTAVQTTSSSNTSLEVRVRLKLQQARNLIAEGKIAFEQGVYYRAFGLFTESMGIAQEAKILVSTARELKIELRRQPTEDRNFISTSTIDAHGYERVKDADKSESKKGDKGNNSNEQSGRSDRAAEMKIETPVGAGAVNVRIR